MKSQGFTLIEILVVVAIIGILSSVVIVSLSSTKKKGAVAFVKKSMSEIRTQANLYYAVNGDYGTAQSFDTFLSSETTFCSNTCFLDDATILSSLKRFDPYIGAYYSSSHPDQNHYMSYVISTDKQRWALSVSMVNGPKTYCIDSTGQSVLSSTKDQYAIMFGGDGKCLP